MEHQHPPSKYSSRTQLRNHVWKVGYFAGLKEAETSRYMLKDTKKRTVDRNKMDTMSQVAIWAGLVMLVAVLLYAGAVVDAVIGVMNI